MSRRTPYSRRQFLKSVAAGLGVAGAPALLAACGSQPANTPVSSQPTAPGVTSGSSSATGEVTHWDWWVTQSPWIENEIKLFQEANPGITITRTLQPDKKIDELLSASFRDGSTPDTFFTLLPFVDLVKGQYVAPLSDFEDFAAYQNTFPNPAIDFAEGSNMQDGKIYAAPREARSAWWNQIYVHTGLLKEAGWTENGGVRLPATLEEFIQAQRDVLKASGGKAYGWSNPFSTGWTPVMWWFMGQLSGAPFGADNFKTGRYDFSSPVWRQILEGFVTMRDEGLILPESNSLDDEGIRALFAEGRSLYTTTGIWAIPGWKQTHPDFSSYTLMPPPLVGVNEPVSYFQSSPGQAGTAMYISAKTAKREAAWAWYKWLNSRQAMQRWVEQGLGLSLWSEDNDPKYASNEALKALSTTDSKVNRVAPARAVRNPEIGKVKEGDVKPNEGAIISGLFSKQLTDIPALLTQLEADKNAAREQAVKDAVAAGAKINFPEDYAFPDWDPTKDYVTNKK
ncbi:MAG: hypothetical protein OHK0022_04380 [Roseiflexaceae bacterium]